MKNRMKLFVILTMFLVMVSGGCGSSPVVSVPDELDLAIRDASDYLNDNIPEGSMIVILNIESDSSALSEYIIDELIANAVNDRIFKVVDRQQLDLIRTEQYFQLSGEVDDDLALSIGKFFGAQTIVSGRVRQLDDRFRLTIRALEVQTAQVQGQYNRNILAGRTITALMRSGGGAGRGTQSAPARVAGSSTIGTSGSVSETTSTTETNSGTTTASIPAPIVVVPTVSSVSISPDSVSVDKGKTHQFTATVTGTNEPDTTVIWTVTGNTSSKTHISTDGLLTVGDDENITPLTVTATSTVDRSKNGSATVAVPGGISAINVSSVANWNTAINTVRNGGNNKSYIINVTGNVSVPAPPTNENLFGSVTGITVNIQGSGTLALSVNGSLLSIAAGQTVVVRDVTLRGRSGNNTNNNAPVVDIRSGGIFRMEGRSSVTGNNNYSGFNTSSGGVYVGSNAIFTMQDSATVTGNSGSDFKSGGVCIDGGTFTMLGGTISGNTNSATLNRAAVYIISGTFTMQGGTISGNTASTFGGGVYVSGGTFTMQGGTISGNTTNGYGGGVYIDGSGTFNMQGGTISGNNAVRGGGVYINSGTFKDKGTFTKTGGTISGNDEALGNRNSVTQQGHAIYWYSSPERWRNATAGPDDNTAGYGFWLND